MTPFEKLQERLGKAEAAEAIAAGTPFERLKTKVDAYKEPEDPQRSAAKEISRQAGLKVRQGIEGVIALPAVPANAAGHLMNALTMGAGNFGTDASGAVSNLLTDIGLPKEENASERVTGDITRGLAGIATGIGAGNALINGGRAVASKVGGVMASNPILQAASATAGTGAADVIRENGGSPLAQIGAGVAGALIPPLAAGAGGVIANYAKGGGVSPAVANLAKTAEGKFDIPISAAKISSSPFIKHLDSLLSKIPFTGNLAKDDAARTAFTRAVSRTFGADSDSLTPEVMKAARTRIGQTFDDVAKNTAIKADDAFVSNLTKIANEIPSVVAESEAAPLRTQIQNILSKVGDDGVIDGKAYQTLTSKGSPLDRVMSSSDSNIRHYAGQIRETLDDALERSASPEALQSLRQARLEWKNMRTVQDLAAKAGIEGEISPALLLGAVKKSYKDMPYSGAGDVGELAQIGQRFLKEAPTSGTAERLQTLNMLRGAGLFGGGLMAGNPAAAVGTVLGAAGVAGAGKAASLALNSNWYKNRLLSSIEGGVLGQPLQGSLDNPLLDAIGNTYAPISTVTGNSLINNAP